MHRFLALICCLAAASTGMAKAPARSDSIYVINTWETGDGLPDNSATCMVQDRQGYLWFGTFGGLVRFDGVSFTTFDAFNTPALPADGIVNLYLDRAERLWVSTVKGLAMRDSTGWHSVDGWVGDFVRTFSECRDGRLLLTTFNGLLLESNGVHLRQLPLPPGKVGKGYFGHADEAGRWWVTRFDFIGYWDGTRWVATPELGSAWACCKARDGGIWLLNNQGLRKFRDRQEIATVPFAEASPNVLSMCEDREGEIWIATMSRGVYRISSSGESRRWTTANGLSSDATRFVFEDSEGDHWVGTSGGGLQRFKPRRFQSIGVDTGLLEPVVHSICPTADGNVLIGTYGGGLLQHRDGKCERLAIPTWDGGRLVYVQSVLADRSGRIWVGTFNHGVWILDGGGATHISPDRTGGGNVVTLFEDSRGRIWMCGERGVAIYEAGEFRDFAADAAAPHFPVRFAEDAQGTIWAAGHDGAFRFRDNRFTELRNNERPIREINAVFSDSAGVVWMAPAHDDLLCCREGTIAHIDSAAGFVTSGIRSITEDTHGRLWLASSRGIFCVGSDELMGYARSGRGPVKFNVFDLKDGLPSLDFPVETQPACICDKEGCLWFATSKGVAVIDPQSLRPNILPPPVDIQTLVYSAPSQAETLTGRHRREVRLQGPFPAPPQVVAGGRSIEIHYAALSFPDTSKVHYQIRLDPLDTDWQDQGNQHSVNFHELGPGDYVFRVRAANNDGLWNMQGASLAFTVQPFFWQTAWFRGGVGFGLVAIGAVTAWWFAHRKHRREMELQLQRNELAHLSRVTMLGELSGSLAHELNQPLAAIMSNAEAAQRFLGRDPVDPAELKEILKDIINDDERAGEIIRRLRLLLKKGEVNHQLLDMNELVSDVLRLVHSDLLNHDVVVETKLEAALPAVYGDRIQLQQVLLNLVMNACDAIAVNSNGNRRVTVCTRRLDDNSIQTSVTDQGCGIAEDRLARIFEPFYTTKPHGMGLGLSVSRTIVAAHGGELSASNNQNLGATFRMTLKPAGEIP